MCFIIEVSILTQEFITYEIALQTRKLKSKETSGILVSVILNETNYTLWSQLMEMRIEARNKKFRRQCQGPSIMDLMKHDCLNRIKNLFQPLRMVDLYPHIIMNLLQSSRKIDHRSTPQAESVEGIVQLHAVMMRLQSHSSTTLWEGAYYWKQASRKEEIKVKMMVADDGTLSEIVVQGDDQQVEQMRKELQFSEKGMVYVKGIFERWQKLN
ncbi:hypothetical protein NC653_004815 [Populus alba x Populus x berolinensis]|uniref:Retrotransposon Copia-like N-terminal domain-containing protein n=1 Tax=Populus alba x Populus x berolinensis TaxID=444605 RepID=A0AAD6RUX3_9ROSI|nr:hypothetical protein NC653_004815 [Populus alba x Populus x berolinensis]